MPRRPGDKRLARAALLILAARRWPDRVDGEEVYALFRRIGIERGVLNGALRSLEADECIGFVRYRSGKFAGQLKWLTTTGPVAAAVEHIKQPPKEDV